jgi:hypothetical protein
VIRHQASRMNLRQFPTSDVNQRLADCPKDLTHSIPTQLKEIN